MHKSTASSVLLPVLALVGSVTALGLGTSYAKQLFPVIGAQGTSALRVGLSALVLLLIFRPWRHRLHREDLPRLLIYGACLGLMNLLFYMSLRTVPFGVAVAIEFTGPLAVAVYFSRSRYDFLWVLLAVTGLLLLLPLGFGSLQLDLAGVLYAFGAAVCWALYILFGKSIRHLRAGQTVSLGVLAGSLILVPVGVMHAGASALLQPPMLLMGLGIAIVSSAIPISLEMYALKRLPRETFGIMLSLEPAVAALAGLVFLQEYLTLQQWLAIGCIILASAGSVASFKSRRQNVQSQEPAEAA